MNQQLSALLEKLATKLGTTTEYLWHVLLKQARISATITLFYFIASLIIGVIIYKLHRRFMTTPEKPHSNNLYYEHEELGAIMVVVAAIWGICFIWIISSLSNIFNGYFNPEYWALNEIFSSIK
jgi:hypothetical protein